LIKHPDFSLPGKKTLLENEKIEGMALIDVTESPIQRPKKSKDNKEPGCGFENLKNCGVYQFFQGEDS